MIEFSEILKDNEIEIRRLNATFKDAQMFLDGIHGDDERLEYVFCKRWLDETANSVENIYEWIKGHIGGELKNAPFEKGSLFGIFIDKEFAGFFELCHIWDEAKSAETSSYIQKRFEGKGIMSRVRKMMEKEYFGNVKWNRLVAGCVADNERSKNLLEKNGYIFEGTQRDGCIIGGKLKDRLTFCKLKSDWTKDMDGEL